MNINCQRCHRSYSIAEEKVADRAALRCICGERLSVRSQADQGEKIGNYVLLQRIAVGGMGEIYLAKEFGAEGFEKEAAIKKMLPHLSRDRSFIDMMVKEAKLTNQLKHPNIVGIYNFAKEGDEYYMAMEYVPGITVASLLEQSRRRGEMLPYEVVVHIVIQLLRGLAYAHNFIDSQGQRSTVLHRDITPQNILVTQSGFVKITDFGIAKAVNEISTTSPGMIKGKLGYIAPEQLTGIEPDHRLDLFCAAILMWEMFMVQRLFKGNSEAETFHLISQCIIPPLGDKRNDVPPAIEQVMLRGLAKNRDERFLRAEEFIAELSRSIFPRTPDEYAEVAASYFQNHDSLFESVHAISQREIQPATRALIASVDGSEVLDPVTNFGQELSSLMATESQSGLLSTSQVNLVNPQQGSLDPGLRGLYVVMLAMLGIIMMSLVGVGFYLWQKENISQVPQPTTAVTTIGTPVQSTLGKERSGKAHGPQGTLGKKASPDEAAPAEGKASKPPSDSEKPAKVKPAGKANAGRNAGQSSLAQVIQSQQNKLQRSFFRCTQDLPPNVEIKKVNAKVELGSGGEVDRIRILPSTGSAEVDSCLEKVMRDIPYPSSAEFETFNIGIDLQVD